MGHILSKVGMLGDFEQRSGKIYQNLFWLIFREWNRGKNGSRVGPR